MTYEAILQVIRYCDESLAEVQITGPDYYKDYRWVADFRNQIHADICFEELVAASHDVKRNPTMDGKSYYARLA